MILFILLGILSICYGTIIALANSGSRFFVVWFALGILFFLLAAACHFHIWGRLSPFLRRLLIAGLTVSAAIFIFIAGLIVRTFSSPVESNLDYIVVLGAQVRKDGPALSLRFRLDTAYDYLLQNESTLCIVSGGQGYNEPWSEAQGMYDYLTRKGISPDRIIMEDTSTNTIENILNSSQYMDIANDTIGIVTNNFHLYRGTQLAKKQGYVHTAGIPAPSTAFYMPNNLLRECFGVIKDVIAGHMNLL